MCVLPSVFEIKQPLICIITEPYPLFQFPFIIEKTKSTPEAGALKIYARNRFAFSALQKINVRLRQAVATKLHPAAWI
jgi:hypothetical protein